MPRNGSGVYTLPANSFNPAVADTEIDANYWNDDAADLSTALTNSIACDGQTTITANLPMSGFRHTGVGAATARTQYVDVAGYQDGSYDWVAAGGTADAITATYAPVIPALVDGLRCFVRAGAANATTTPTFAPSGLTAHTITKLGGQALAIGDIYGAGHELVLIYKLASTRWELLNPALPASAPTWTPVDASGASLVLTVNIARKYQIGALMFIYGTITYPVTADASAAVIGGLPTAFQNISTGGAAGWAIPSTVGSAIFGYPVANTTTFDIRNVSGAGVLNSTLSGVVIRFQFTYPVA